MAWPFITLSVAYLSWYLALGTRYIRAFQFHVVSARFREASALDAETLDGDGPWLVADVSDWAIWGHYTLARKFCRHPGFSRSQAVDVRI